MPRAPPSRARSQVGPRGFQQHWVPLNVCGAVSATSSSDVQLGLAIGLSVGCAGLLVAGILVAMVLRAHWSRDPLHV